MFDLEATWPTVRSGSSVAPPAGASGWTAQPNAGTSPWWTWSDRAAAGGESPRTSTACTSGPARDPRGWWDPRQHPRDRVLSAAGASRPRGPLPGSRRARRPPCLDCGGVLKTTTISSGQPLRREVLQAAVEPRPGPSCSGRRHLAERAPAASLVDVAVAAGARLVIVNASPRRTTSSPARACASRSDGCCRAGRRPRLRRVAAARADAGLADGEGHQQRVRGDRESPPLDRVRRCGPRSVEGGGAGRGLLRPRDLAGEHAYRSTRRFAEPRAIRATSMLSPAGGGARPSGGSGRRIRTTTSRARRRRRHGVRAFRGGAREPSRGRPAEPGLAVRSGTSTRSPCRCPAGGGGPHDLAASYVPRTARAHSRAAGKAAAGGHSWVIETAGQSSWRRSGRPAHLVLVPVPLPPAEQDEGHAEHDHASSARARSARAAAGGGQRHLRSTRGIAGHGEGSSSSRSSSAAGSSRRAVLSIPGHLASSGETSATDSGGTPVTRNSERSRGCWRQASGLAPGGSCRVVVPAQLPGRRRPATPSTANRGAGGAVAGAMHHSVWHPAAADTRAAFTKKADAGSHGGSARRPSRTPTGMQSARGSMTRSNVTKWPVSAQNNGLR
jgi:hypothetical protein